MYVCRPLDSKTLPALGGVPSSLLGRDCSTVDLQGPCHGEREVSAAVGRQLFAEGKSVDAPSRLPTAHSRTLTVGHTRNNALLSVVSTSKYQVSCFAFLGITSEYSMSVDMDVATGTRLTQNHRVDRWYHTIS